MMLNMIGSVAQVSILEGTGGKQLGQQEPLDPLASLTFTV